MKKIIKSYMKENPHELEKVDEIAALKRINDESIKYKNYTIDQRALIRLNRPEDNPFGIQPTEIMFKDMNYVTIEEFIKDISTRKPFVHPLLNNRHNSFEIHEVVTFFFVSVGCELVTHEEKWMIHDLGEYNPDIIFYWRKYDTPILCEIKNIISDKSNAKTSERSKLHKQKVLQSQGKRAARYLHSHACLIGFMPDELGLVSLLYCKGKNHKLVEDLCYNNIEFDSVNIFKSKSNPEPTSFGIIDFFFNRQPYEKCE